LLNLTTRSVSPTEAGERLYETVGARFEDVEAELAVLGEMRGRPVGTVRITVTEHSMRSLSVRRIIPNSCSDSWGIGARTQPLSHVDLTKT
jgi:DNA-binding transcriptional LysR family regulator